jgi:hypothetical protein
MTVREMLARIDSHELTEWRAFYELEPFGGLIEDQRHGIATATLANVNRDSKRKLDAYEPRDFIPWHESHRKPPEPTLLADPKQHAQLVKRTLFGSLLKAIKGK